MRKYFIEFIGTFFLVLIVALTGNPIAIGFGLAALVYMGGYISGAQYNPAVTFAVWLSKKIDTKTALLYVCVQFIAAIVAAAVYHYVTSLFFIPQPGIAVPFGTALLLEVLFTFLLASVVLHTAVSEQTKGNDYYGLAIGSVVLVGAFAAGPISGGAFNPAVGVGPLLFDVTHLAQYGIQSVLYIVGPLLGAGIAAVVYKGK
ncbi:MAG TPA: aquaporin [Patescibacteria group bacterium]|nr:aquaporin [Patescibacteria group bacterium]